MKYILALDQGTTSSRALLINKEGSIVFCAQQEFTQHFPSPGWVEHDPEEIWASMSFVIKEALLKTSCDEIASIGITNQRETTVIWDTKTKLPICNAIVWQDRRTAPICEKLKKEGKEGLFQKKTGLRLDPYFSGTKIHWILGNIPGARERAERGELRFGTIDSFLVYKLSGGELHITDASNASRTLLYNINTGNWDEELLDLLDIPKSLLPKVCNSSQVYGKTHCSLFSKDIPISGIIGDQQGALFAQGCFKPGMAKTTYGTGCFLLMHTGTSPVFSKNNLLTTVAYQINNKLHYALEGSVFIGGAVVQWLRDELGIIKSSSEIEKLSMSVPDNGGVYFVPAFTGLGAPYWDPYAKGAIFGITRGTNAGHIARASLEAIAHQVTDVLQAMEKDGHLHIEELRVDGGAVVDNQLMQLQADLLRVPILRPNNKELTALGSAYLAGLSIGFWKDLEEIASHWQLDKKFEPKMNVDQATKMRESWERAIACAQMWGKK